MARRRHPAPQIDRGALAAAERRTPKGLPSLRLTSSAALALTSVAVLAPAAGAQTTNCPPGQQAVGAYCENKPSEGKPQSQNSNANPPGQAKGGVAGFSGSSADVAALQQEAKEQLVDQINAALGAGTVKASDIVITQTSTGFVASLKKLSASREELLSSKGVPVAAVGCTVDACVTANTPG